MSNTQENNNYKQELQTLKQQTDIVSVAGLYGELRKNGASYIYINDKSIKISPSKQIFTDFNGNITGGSVLDLICYMEKVDLKQGIEKLKEINGIEEYRVDESLRLKRQEEASKPKFSLQQLEFFSKNDIKKNKHLPYNLIIEEKEVIRVPSIYKRLFQKVEFPLSYKKKLDYLFSQIIGYDSYFKAPSISLKDNKGTVVDKATYRPNKPDHIPAEKWGKNKYYYKNSDFRGANFLYPFQNEVERIINRENYMIIGEGLKNSVNALIYSIPYISIESASNKSSTALYHYINKNIDQGKGLMCMIDGDNAGKRAYLMFMINFLEEAYKTTVAVQDKDLKRKPIENSLVKSIEKIFKEKTKIEIQNLFEFDSGIDFTDYITGKKNE